MLTSAISAAGDFEGATGTITWGAPKTVNGNPGLFYTFKLALAPKSAQTGAGAQPNAVLNVQPTSVQTEAAMAG